MPNNFSVITKGPLIPKGVNEKSFVSVKIAPLDKHVFKEGNVVKMTAGKIRLRNEEEKSFTNENSAVAAKDDVIEITGAVIGMNEDKETAAGCRVFTSLSYKPTPSKKSVAK